MQQGLRLPVNGDEQELGIAIQEDKIIHLKNLEPLKEVLRLAMVMVGLRQQNFPEGVEKELLLRFIIENYGGHTPSEIKLAFTMAINGKLGLETKEVVCYENFSVLYFSSIMNAYRTWAKEAVFHIPKIPLPELPAPVDEITDDEFIESVKISYKAANWKIIPVAAYNVLYKQGKINLDNDTRKKIIETVDAAFPDLDEKARTNYYKSYSVMLFFENEPQSI